MTTTDPVHVPPTVTSSAAVTGGERIAIRTPAAARAERRGWLILWLAFATFCALIFAIAKFTIEYVSTAEVDQSAQVTSARGLVLVVNPGSGDTSLLGSRSELGVGTTVALDRSSVGLADLRLFDGSVLKLQSGSTVELTRMEVGRFINQHSLQLTQTTGAVRYAPQGPLDLVVPNGFVQLEPHGDYTVWLDNETTRVLVYGGEAHLSSNGAAINVDEGQRGEINEQLQVMGPFERQMQLLPYGNFAQQDQGWQSWDKVSGEQDKIGTRYWVSGPDDLPGAIGLRVTRDSVRQQHGETGLTQKLDADVAGFRHLWLRAWVRVDSADLSGGGQLGSEYPMMFQVQYEGPVDGSREPWAIGFYDSNPEQLPVQESTGVLWPQGEWRPYEVDLMNTDASRVPYHLLGFAVMGQGHSFDARVANIQLTGE